MLTKIFTVMLFLLVAGIAQSQKGNGKHFEKALGYYQSGELQKALSEARKANPADRDILLLLAEIGHELDSTEMEILYLEEALKTGEDPVIYIRLGEIYYKSAVYQKALPAFEKGMEKGDLSDPRRKEILRKIENCRFAIRAMAEPLDFKPELLGSQINSAADEYWPGLSVDGQVLFFTRLIKTSGSIPQEDFYYAEWDGSAWKEAKPVQEINTPLNEGTQTVSADGKLLFFTSCNRPGGFGSCDIYYAVRQKSGWGTPVNAGNKVNSAGWESQPCVSSDNRFLFFSSERAGGFGGKDIWKTEITGIDQHGNIQWGETTNAGDKINTAGNEISPFLHPNNTDFYFVSDFHTGMGGMDIFRAQTSHDLSFGVPENLGYPVNTSADEQGLFISTDGMQAYFASARDKQTGMDIYKFPTDPRMRPEPATFVKITVTNRKTGSPVAANVELTSLNNIPELYAVQADNSGMAFLCVPAGKDYALHVSATGFLFYSANINVSDQQKSTFTNGHHVSLDPVDPGMIMELYNIFFETDSFRILPESEPELLRLAGFLTLNPTLNVEIQGHTDSSGIKEKNQVLSEKRAESVYQYLMSKGIDEKRLDWAGYGAEKPVAGNDSPEGRRLNRRTSVKILTH